MIRPQTCPICNTELAIAPAQSAHFPFCSQRCKQIDMHRWCEGKYAILEPLDLHAIEPDDGDHEG